MQLKLICSIALSCVLSLGCISTIFAQNSSNVNKKYLSEKTNHIVDKEVSSEYVVERSKDRIAEYEQKLLSTEKLLERHYYLSFLVIPYIEVGELEKSEACLKELTTIMHQFTKSWNYGNAIHSSNVALGRLEIRKGNIKEAANYLLEAGKTPGSPQLNSFGPNMSLAKELLERGEIESVVKYFELCKKFWKMDYGKLEEWTNLAKAGQIPAFRANLLH
jgi:hypothetical protein